MSNSDLPKMIIFKNNISINTEAMLSLKGLYTISKDGRVYIETKDVNREKKVVMECSGFMENIDTKKIAEILSAILITSSGFIRDINDLEVLEDNEKVVITIKK